MKRSSFEKEMVKQQEKMEKEKAKMQATLAEETFKIPERD